MPSRKTLKPAEIPATKVTISIPQQVDRVIAEWVQDGAYTQQEEIRTAAEALYQSRQAEGRTEEMRVCEQALSAMLYTEADKFRAEFFKQSRDITLWKQGRREGVNTYSTRREAEAFKENHPEIVRQAEATAERMAEKRVRRKADIELIALIEQLDLAESIIPVSAARKNANGANR